MEHNKIKYACKSGTGSWPKLYSDYSYFLSEIEIKINSWGWRERRKYKSYAGNVEIQAKRTWKQLQQMWLWLTQLLCYIDTFSFLPCTLCIYSSLSTYIEFIPFFRFWIAFSQWEVTKRDERKKEKWGQGINSPGTLLVDWSVKSGSHYSSDDRPFFIWLPLTFPCPWLLRLRLGKMFATTNPRGQHCPLWLPSTLNTSLNQFLYLRK